MSRFFNATPENKPTAQTMKITVNGKTLELTKEEIEKEFSDLCKLAATKPNEGEGMSYREQKVAINSVKGLYDILDYYSRGIRPNSKAQKGQTMPDRLASPGDSLSALASQLMAAIVSEIRGSKGKPESQPAQQTEEEKYPIAGDLHWRSNGELLKLLKDKIGPSKVRAIEWNSSNPQLAHPRSDSRRDTLLALLK